MLTTIRVLRVLVGLVAAWQVVGLLPVFTSWLPNLQNVTGDMWALALIKAVVMLLCGGIYFWLGRVKHRADNSGAERSTSDARIIIFSVLALLTIGVVLAISIPALSDGGVQIASDEAEIGPWSEYQSLQADIASPVTQQPEPEEGQWQCSSSNGSQPFRLFLFPDAVVYMSVEPDKWALMDDLKWQSVNRKLFDQSVAILTVRLLTESQASIQWPAGEAGSCIRG